jgi:hypothetical protein
MTAETKRAMLVLFCLTVAAVTLIAAALPQLHLLPAIPLPSLEGKEELVPEEKVQTISISILTLLKMALGILLIVTAVIAGYKLRKQIPWRKILPSMLFWGALGLIVLYVLFLMQNVQVEADFQAPEIIPPAVNITGPELGPVSPNLIGLVWIALAAAGILAGAGLLYWSARQSRSGDAVLREAELAIQALKTGSDIRSVIVRCYFQMSQALQKERGIELEETMTARDFESLLEARGIPHDPVHNLTRLFEGVRYGRRRSGAEEEQKAVECLTAIVEYSRGSGRAE